MEVGASQGDLIGQNEAVITAAVDGSSLDNPGPAGWAWYIDDAHWAAGGWPRGTNNMGELMAVLNLLEQTAVAAEQPLHILCDSQYVINSVTKWMPGWKRRGWRKADGKSVLNVDLLKAIDDALVGREVSFDWVKGHAGHEMNEAADDRARAAATAFQLGVPVNAGPGFDGTAAAESLDVAPTAPQREPDLFDEPVAVDRDVDTVIAQEKAALTDAVRSNSAKLRELLHPDFTEYSASGRIWTRGRLLSEVGPLENRTAVEVLGVTRLGPDSILLRWRARSSQRVSLRSSVWLRHEGAWRLLFAQGTPVEG